MMTSTQVVKTSVTTTENNPSQDYTPLDDQTIHYYMSLLGSNHLLYCKYYSPLKNSSCLKFKVDLKMCKNCLFAIKVDFNFYFSES